MGLNFGGDILWRQDEKMEATEGRECIQYLTLKITAFVFWEDLNPAPTEPLLSVSPAPAFAEALATLWSS